MRLDEFKARKGDRVKMMMESQLYYLALPYQGTDEEKAFRSQLSLRATAAFLRQGIHVFSPVNYINQIVEEVGLPSLDERRQMVMPYLFTFLKVSKGLILVTADGWEKSWGVRQELLFCHQHSLPVYKIDPLQLDRDLSRHLLDPLDAKAITQRLEAA